MKILAALAAVCLAGQSLFFPGSAAAADDNFWKIGVLVCLTGACAADGDGALRGAKLAVQEINQYGGVNGKKIKLIVVDTNEAVSGASAVTAYRQLRTDPDLKYFIGPTWTPAALALAPIIAEEPDVTIITPTVGVKTFHQAGENIFNSRGADEAPISMAAKYAYDKGIRNIAIFSSQQPWETQQTKYFEEAFTKLGGAIAVKVEPPPTVTTLDAEALKITAAKPDGIFIASLIQQGIFAKALRKLNFQGLKLAALVDEARLKEADGTLDGTIFFSYEKPLPHFVERFKKVMGGSPPELSAAVGYDTVYIFAKAAEKAQSFHANEVRNALLDLDFPGASGKIRFGEKRVIKRDPVGFEIHQGKIVHAK